MDYLHLVFEPVGHALHHVGDVGGEGPYHGLFTDTGELAADHHLVALHLDLDLGVGELPLEGGLLSLDGDVGAVNGGSDARGDGNSLFNQSAQCHLHPSVDVGQKLSAYPQLLGLGMADHPSGGGEDQHAKVLGR